MKEDNYCIRRPLHISDLCYFIYCSIANDYNGIYHFYNPYNKYTKYEICQIIGKYLDIQIDNIIPNNNKSEGIAPRPYDTQLQDDKIAITNYDFMNFNESIEQCFKKYKHPKINITNRDDVFIFLDLDGTIIESNLAHFNAYNKTFQKHNIPLLTIDKWNDIILNDNIDNYLYYTLQQNDSMISIIKQEKQSYLTDPTTISFTKNSDEFLRFLIENNFNFCVVTNTSEKTVQIFKEKLPLLNDIKQWVYRDNYKLPKPNGECYDIAKQKYYKNEKYVIGFEDSMVGYNALKHHTDLIYVYNNDNIFKNNDCYLFDDYSVFI
jgi:beta-phosphoglucomutase-like phosphatase (HAD superfamily)